MTVTTSIRPAVKTWLKERLSDRLDSEEVVVLRSWDGKLLERSTVWIQRTTGETTFPFAMAGRKDRDDEFTVHLVFTAVHPGDSEEDAEARVLAYVNVLEDLIADDPSLGGLDGVIHATYSMGDGPDTYPAGDEGFGAMQMVDVNVKSRLS